MDEAYEQEQSREKLNIQERIRAWAGMMGVPGAPLIAVDAIAHGGLTPIGIGGFVLALGTAQGIKSIEKWGRSEKFLLALCHRPKRLQWLNGLTGNYFTRQIYELHARKPHLFSQPHEASPAEIDAEEETFNQAEEEIVKAVEQALHQQKTAKPATVVEAEEQVSLFQGLHSVDALSSIRRLTIDEICENVPRNQFWIYVGRSMTAKGNPAVPISFYNQHFKVIGASQKGKSSMIGAMLEIITRTHDRRHLRVSLLDLENRTSKLFEDIPHLASVTVGGKSVRLHARNREQVLEYLGYIFKIMEQRYTMSSSQLEEQPWLLVYVEEFLALKNYYKAQVEATKKNPEKNAQARENYSNLTFWFTEIALRGLKAQIQFLLAAQVEYRDDDLVEALTSITSGFSFAVKPTAAQAAGFYQNELLKKNAADNKVGQFVVEVPAVKDIVLAPDFPVRERLLAWEKTHKHTSGAEDDSFVLPVDEKEEENDEEREERPQQAQSRLPVLEPVRLVKDTEADRQEVLNACRTLVAQRRNTSADNIAELVSFGRDKALRIRKQLVKDGLLVEDQGGSEANEA